ncbi:MAG: MotA/TolQ/ExbB proton channel family protein [Candidatus Omnitrophota bacterium]
MAITTITGLLLAAFFLLFGIATRGGMSRIMVFVDPGSLMLVVGASISALITNYTFKEIWLAMKAIRFAFLPKPPMPEAVIDLIVRMAIKARKEGFISLREESSGEKFHLVDLGVGLIADGTDPEVTREILDAASFTEGGMLASNERVWRDLSVYTPMFGMVGTLIGLILMLRGLSDPATIGPAMAMALITTLYGIVIAGVLCLPIAGKIKNYNDRVAVLRTLMIEGLISIQAGDNSQIVEARLKAHIAKES